MARSVNDIIDGIIKVEGGYTVDTGGPTMYGITQAVARKAGYKGDMRDLPISLARQIYLDEYVVKPGFDKIREINDTIAAEMVDTGVNMGPAWAVTFLQQSLNALAGAKLVVDGKLGPQTRTTLSSFLSMRKVDGVSNVLKCLNSLQGARYIDLASTNPAKYQAYVNGWIANRVDI